MKHSETGAKRRLERLERLLAGREARLAATLAAPRRRRVQSGPIGNLQRYGYPVALLLALTAVLPKVVGFGWGRRKLLFGAAANGLVLNTLRKRFDAVRSTEGNR